MRDEDWDITLKYLITEDGQISGVNLVAALQRLKAEIDLKEERRR